jgi:hypothetical protein
MSDDRYRIHNELVNKVLLFVHEHFTGRYWGNPTGAVKTENGHFQRYGLVGSTDITGFTDQGRSVFIEIKTGSGVLSKVQKNFKQMALTNNCIHIVIHDEFNIDSFKGMRKK